VEAVRSILGLRQTYNIALVGAGNLGSAIASSAILPKRGFVIHDVFDNDPQKIGRTVGNIVVKHIDELKKSADEAEEMIGIIATPSSAAQEVADLMVDAGVKVILNYTDVLLHVPYGVNVHRIDPTAQLMHTLYYLTQHGEEAAS
jgi:redox-sensing transcriptional repressor